VRGHENQGVGVFTEHTDRIHPQDLSNDLVGQFGKDKFRVSLRKNIYVVYIDMRKSGDDDVGTVYS
jgi:hypothetical protein